MDALNPCCCLAIERREHQATRAKLADTKEAMNVWHETSEGWKAKAKEQSERADKLSEALERLCIIAQHPFSSNRSVEHCIQHIGALRAENDRLREALERIAKHWFNKNDPNDEYHACACAGCDMGEAGNPVDDRGHDIGCVMGIAGAALKQCGQESVSPGTMEDGTPLPAERVISKHSQQECGACKSLGLDPNHPAEEVRSVDLSHNLKRTDPSACPRCDVTLASGVDELCTEHERLRRKRAEPICDFHGCYGSVTGHHHSEFSLSKPRRGDK